MNQMLNRGPQLSLANLQDELEVAQHSSLLSLGRDGLYLRLRYALEHQFGSNNHDGHPEVTLFRKEDTSAWLTFTVIFTFLIVFDNFILHRNNQRIGVGRACAFALFWVCTALGFSFYIRDRFGSDAAFSWASGYLLEWMLSFDNLFVFHMIFTMYKTPDDQKHKPLFWGIVGAVVFRLAFIFLGEWLMHALWAAHLIFGAFLVYTGYQTFVGDDEDEDPTDNALVKFLADTFPMVPCYSAQGEFFTNVYVDEKTGRPILEDAPGAGNPQAEEAEAGLVANAETSSSAESAVSQDQVRGSESTASLSKSKNYGTLVDFAAVRPPPRARVETRATLLFLVLVCLEASDILFAVDSVSAIVASVSDLFLAYTATVFAMLGLRATFFVIDVLVKLFSLLQHGVGLVLCFVGVKLIISKVYEIPPLVVCLVLFGTLGSSIVSSVLWEWYTAKYRRNAEEDESVVGAIEGERCVKREQEGEKCRLVESS